MRLIRPMSEGVSQDHLTNRFVDFKVLHTIGGGTTRSHAQSGIRRDAALPGLSTLSGFDLIVSTV